MEKSGKKVGKVGNFLFFSRSAVTRHPRSCSERGPSARSCQKINFNYFFWGGPRFFPFYIFPVFIFSPFFPLPPPFPPPFFLLFIPNFFLILVVKIPKKQGDLTSLLFLRCNSLRYTSFFTMSVLLFTHISGTLPNFSSIFPFFPFSPFRKVKMGKKKHQLFPCFPPFSPFFPFFPLHDGGGQNVSEAPRD